METIFTMINKKGKLNEKKMLKKFFREKAKNKNQVKN